MDKSPVAPVAKVVSLPVECFTISWGLVVVVTVKGDVALNEVLVSNNA